MAKKEKKKLREHDVVVMKKDSTHAKMGEVGTIVFEYESGSFEVEFEDKVVLILPDEIRLYEEVWGIWG